MKIIVLMVASLNGKITKDSDPNIYSWTSKEDQKLFFSMIKSSKLIVMGRKTYEASKKIMKLSRNKLRLVLTRNSNKYKSEKGTLEFTSESPKELVKRLRSFGYKKMLVVGGATTNTLFFKNLLVDELHLTIEPRVFGLGKHFVSDESMDIKLKLIKIKKLNKRGSLHLHYKIQK